MTPDFTPAWFLRGPHAQTIWGRLARPRRLVAFRREVIRTPDDDDLVLDHLDAPVTDPRFRFVLMHGLEGSSYSVYVQGVMAVIARHGFAATAMNFRSCARDPKRLLRMLPNRRPRFYHSGETGDFDFLVRTLGFGASLGGNVLLKWLGEHPDQTMVSAAATLSVPYDLAAGARHLERGLGPWYVARFLRTLKEKVRRLGNHIDVDAAMRSRNFYEFDETATAPIHGFTGADDYYARSSSMFFLDKITTPTLTMNAGDDPFLPSHVLPRAQASASPAVDFRVTRGGGHVGFVSGAAPWKCEYWAEEMIVRWLAEHGEP